MSRPAGAQGGSYDPLPTNHSTPDLGYRDEQDIAASASSTPGYDHLQFDFDPTTMASLERPRFMGTVPGEGPSIRDSVASYNTRPQSTVNSSVYALNTDQPGSARDSPDPRSDFSYRDDPSAPYPDEGTGVPMAEVGSNRYLSEKRNTYAAPGPLKSKRNLFIIGGIVVAVIIAIAVAVPVAINAKKSSSNLLLTGLSRLATESLSWRRPRGRMFTVTFRHDDLKGLICISQILPQGYQMGTQVRYPDEVKASSSNSRKVRLSLYRCVSRERPIRAAIQCLTMKDL